MGEGPTFVGELHTAGFVIMTVLTVEDVQQVRGNKDLAVVQAKGIRQIFFPINAKADTPLKDKRVRQAINLAIDRETIVRDVLQGFADVRTGPFGMKQMGYNPEAAKFLAYNPQKAKTLLKDAGFPKASHATWNLRRGCWLKDTEVLEVVANQLKAVGIRVKINLLDVNQLIGNQNTANFQIGMIRWSRQVDSDTIIAGIQAQSSTQKWYANEEVDRLIVKGRETLDRAAREKVYQDLYRAMVEDPGYVFLHAQDSIWGKRASSDWDFNAFAGNASLTLLVR